MLLNEGRTDTKKRIINELLKGEKSLGELSEKINLSKQAIIKHVKKLEEKNMIKGEMKKKGNLNVKTYTIGNYSSLVSINEEGIAINYETNSPINFTFPLLNQIPQKDLRDQMSIYLKNIVNINKNFTIVVFGSVSRGEASWKSDIDVLFLSDKWSKKIKDKIIDNISDTGMDEKINNNLNPIFKTTDEIDDNSLFYEEIREDGMIIYNNRDDLNLWKKMKRYRSI
ncbi:MAG: winged helix-turn-helix transcriptional regulator [Candidatus Woesearchaeota archaeon]